MLVLLRSWNVQNTLNEATVDSRLRPNAAF